MRVCTHACTHTLQFQNSRITTPIRLVSLKLRARKRNSEELTDREEQTTDERHAVDVGKECKGQRRQIEKKDEKKREN